MIFKLISESNATSDKIPRGFLFCGNRQTNSKTHIERHRAWNSQEKNNCWRKRAKKNITSLFCSELPLGSFHRRCWCDQVCEHTCALLLSVRQKKRAELETLPVINRGHAGRGVVHRAFDRTEGPERPARDLQQG